MNENINTSSSNIDIIFDNSIDILKIISVPYSEKRKLDITEIFETKKPDQE